MLKTLSFSHPWLSPSLNFQVPVRKGLRREITSSSSDIGLWTCARGSDMWTKFRVKGQSQRHWKPPYLGSLIGASWREDYAEPHRGLSQESYSQQADRADGTSCMNKIGTYWGPNLSRIAPKPHHISKRIIGEAPS